MMMNESFSKPHAFQHFSTVGIGSGIESSSLMLQLGEQRACENLIHISSQLNISSVFLSFFFNLMETELGLFVSPPSYFS